jgi:hypothetical protein
MIRLKPTLIVLTLSSLLFIGGCAGREETNTSANTSANTAGTNANSNNPASNANANARNANAVARNANAVASNANAVASNANVTASNANAVARNANARPIARAAEANPTNGETPIPEPTVGSFPNVEPSPMATLETVTRGGPAELDELDREVAKLHEGKILFNPPSEMKQGKRERIEARVSFEDIGAALSQDLKGRAAPQIEPVKVSSIMKVILTGDQDAFAIEQFGTDEQIVKGRPFAQWSWDVTPLQSGKRSLHLQVTAVVSVAGRDKTIGIPVIDKRIQVHISPWFASKRFVSNNWQWLWTVIVVPGAGLFWGLRKKKRRKRSRTNHEI